MSTKPENSGGSVNYYKLTIDHPANLPDPYSCEAEDIIETLGMTFAEGNVFKSIWRRCAERSLGKQKAGNLAIRDAQKAVYYSNRILAQDRNKDIQVTIEEPTNSEDFTWFIEQVKTFSQETDPKLCRCDHKLQGTGAVFYQSTKLLQCANCKGWQMVRKPIEV